MRMELQLSYTFMADFLAGKVVSIVAGALPVGSTVSPAQLLPYEPSVSPDIANHASGVIRVNLKFGPFLQLQLDLSAAIANSQVQITATLANHDAVVALVQQFAAGFDASQIPSTIKTTLDVVSLLAVDGATPAQIPAPTQAGFAADDTAQVIALRVELGAVASGDVASWTDFNANHNFTPLFEPADVTANPPRHWAIAVDWKALQPVFVAQIKPVIKQQLLGVSSDGALTGDLLFAWNLKNGDQPSGFSDSWPLGGTNTADLDVTCPIHVSGHDGHIYIQAQFSSAGLNHMKVHALLKAHVSCKWKDVNPVNLTIPIGAFALEVNSLLVENVRTNARGLILGGDVLFAMPLLFPSPQVDVGAFFWTYLNACDMTTLCQDLGVYLSDANAGAGLETQLKSKIHITASFPVTVNGTTKPDANGVYTGNVAWDVTVKAADVPAAGGSVTLSILTNAGTPTLGAGTALTTSLAPALTQRQKLLMEVAAVAACQNAKHEGYVASYPWTPPEEIIWWLTQEINITPATAGYAAQVTLGPSARVAVSQAELPAAARQLAAGNEAIVRSTSTSALGVRVVYSSIQRGG
jgi:hypothetical protein